MALSSSNPGRASLFNKAVEAERLDDNTYKLILRDSYCIGSVPNGGYSAACMLSAASAYLATRSLPGDVLAAHFEYPSRTEAGVAYVTVQDVKLGRQLSMLHLTLWQDGLLDQKPWLTPSVSKPKLLAYSRHADIRNFDGASINTPLHVKIPPKPDFEALKKFGKDGRWAKQAPPTEAHFVKTLQNWDMFLPQHGAYSPGILEVWMRLANGEHIKQSSLAYVADSFPYNMHHHLSVPEKPATLPDGSSSGAQGVATQEGPLKSRGKLWFPTLSLGLEAKRMLPEEGVEWVFVRTMSQQFRDGRFDLEVQIRDVDDNLIALSQQVGMIVSMDRNTAGRAPAKAAL